MGNATKEQLYRLVWKFAEDIVEWTYFDATADGMHATREQIEFTKDAMNEMACEEIGELVEQIMPAIKTDRT